MNAKMAKRIVFGSIMIAFMVGLFLLDWFLTQDQFNVLKEQWQAAPGAPLSLRAVPLAGLFFVLMLLALGEMKGFAAGAGTKLLTVSAFLGTLGIGMMPFWWQLAAPAGIGSGDQPWASLLLGLGLVVMLVFLEQMARRTTAGAFSAIGATLLTVLYLGVGGAMILSIRLTFNLPALVLFLVAVKFTDIGAYFTGSFIGKHKLIPWLSPGKSWEGLAGGIATAAGVSALLVWAMPIRLGVEAITPAQAALFGAIVGLVGQFADLCESLLKRSVNVKDSGHFLPEFGGILDILDSPLLAAPAAYLLLCLLK